MKIAFVYDRVIKFGGAERVLLALHEIWPDAPLFTAVYNSKTASWASVFKIKSSFLQYLPLTSSHHELYPIFTPLAFESFDFDDFDVVLSVTSADAKGIITSPNTLHICYLLTPTRYLWNGYHDYLKNPGFGTMNPFVRVLMKVFSPTLRCWDYIAANRPDKYIAISRTVSQRIKSYYKKDSIVIYPPVDTEKFKPLNCHAELVSTGISSEISRVSASRNRSRNTLDRLSVNKFGMTKEDYFLIVSRLVPYKKIDYAVSAFNELGWKLKIIGNGIDEKRLKKLAKDNIEFISYSLTDEKLYWYYQNCKGLIFPGEEDFGISAVEAQACGKPVIGIGKGGVSEIVIPGITGEIYDDYDTKSLIFALKKFIKKSYKTSDCRINATKFAKQNFQRMMGKIVETQWKVWLEKKSI